MHAVDGVRITVVVESWVDILLGEQDGVTRTGLVHHFDPKARPLLAENGFSILVETFNGRHRSTVLFDCGLSGIVIEHNFAALGIDPSAIDHIAISHGHFDHHGGLSRVLDLIGHPVPVVAHPDAFHPRYLMLSSGETAAYYNAALDKSDLHGRGARFVDARDPLPLGDGIISSGEIERTIPFENLQPGDFRDSLGPGIYQIVDGRAMFDIVPDELAVIVNVKSEGLVVISACGHAGIINTVSHAQAITGIDRLALIMGGFHLGFPGTPQDKRDSTVTELKRFGAAQIAPMHCTGFKCMADVARELPDAFVQYSVGTRFHVGDTSTVNSQ